MFRCIRRVAKIATISSVVSACQFARPRETARFTRGLQTFVVFCTEKLYCNSVRKVRIGLTFSNLASYIWDGRKITL